MKNKYSIGFFIAAMAAVAALSGAYRFSYEKAKAKAAKELKIEIQAEKKNEEELETEEAGKRTQSSISADGQALKEDCYYLMEVNGYVVVYLSDRKTPYEYTDILYDELPAILRQEIRNGKYLEGSEELFGFLENYSS